MTADQAPQHEAVRKKSQLPDNKRSRRETALLPRRNMITAAKSGVFSSKQSMFMLVKVIGLFVIGLSLTILMAIKIGTGDNRMVELEEDSFEEGIQVDTDTISSPTYDSATDDNPSILNSTDDSSWLNEPSLTPSSVLQSTIPSSGPTPIPSGEMTYELTPKPNEDSTSFMSKAAYQDFVDEEKHPSPNPPADSSSTRNWSTWREYIFNFDFTTDQPSSNPTSIPNNRPSESPVPTTNDTIPTTTDGPSLPTLEPTNPPTVQQPSLRPTTLRPTTSAKDDTNETTRPTQRPNFLDIVNTMPTNRPTNRPTNYPTKKPTGRPTNRPTPPTPPTDEVTFVPGLLNVQQEGLLLSQGLNARLIAVTNETVVYDKLTGIGLESTQIFHTLPDAGCVFADPNITGNPGGWIYVSNSEDKVGMGGVGAITFDAQGRVIKYERLLEGSSYNCGGGPTPWNTWISCEESRTRRGVLYQVDPTGQRDPQILTLGREGGSWESFAYDYRNPNRPYFYVTEDHSQGAMQRFLPANPTNWDDNDDTAAAWDMLHNAGVIEFLFLHPNKTNFDRGVFSWGRNRTAARNNARLYYPNSEGIDIHDGFIYFVCKKIKKMFELNLDTFEYTRHSTESGLFNGEPDQLKRILSAGGDEFLFFTEDGGVRAGVHGRDENGLFFTVLESFVYHDETTGLAFSIDHKHLYIAYQKNGLLFDVTRKDGRPFHARRLDVKYHSAPQLNIV